MQFLLLYLAQMVVADVRRIANHEVVFCSLALRRLGFREIGDAESQPGSLPQFLRGVTIVRIKLITSRSLHA